MPTPEELDGLNLEEMETTIDEAYTEQLETIDESEAPDQEAEPPGSTAPAFDEAQMAIILGNAIGGVLDGYYNRIGARMITPPECQNIGVAAGQVLDRYLPTLLDKCPELVALGLAMGMPTVVRIQEAQFARRAAAKKEQMQPVDDVETGEANDRT